MSGAETSESDETQRCPICSRTFDSEAAKRRHVREIGLVE